MRFNTFYGFAALPLVLLSSTLLTLFLFTTGEHVFQTRFRELTRTYKLQSYTAAYSCIFAALQVLQEDPNFFPHSTKLEIDTDSSCTIEKIANSSSYVLITTSADVRGISTTLQARTHPESDGFAIDEIYETTSIPP